MPPLRSFLTTPFFPALMLLSAAAPRPAAAQIAAASRAVETRTPLVAAPSASRAALAPFDVSPLAAPSIALPAPLSAPALAAPAAATAALPPRRAPPAAIRPAADSAPNGEPAAAVLSRVALLKNPDESFDARAQMFASAGDSIDAGYFEFSPDETGLTKLALLRAAARRGLKVRLMLDGYGSTLPKALVRHMVDEGVDVRIYHPLRSLHASWLWRRSHDKWTVVDGREMIVGDSNMADKFFGRGPDPWRSREIHVSGPAAAQGRAYVDGMWRSGEVRRPRGLDKVAPEAAAAAGRLVDAHDRPAPAADAPRPWAERAADAVVRFTHNNFLRPHRSGGIGLELLDMIRSAEKTVVIENAYLVFPKIFRDELERAVRERGVRVVIITNSLETNNLPYVRYAYEADRDRLVRMGVELYEFKGPGTLHAKGMVVDGRRAYLGSFNLNPWAFMFNTETGVIVDGHEAVANDLLRRMEATRLESSMVGRYGEWAFPQPRRAAMILRRALLSLPRRLLLGD
ncbi:MAG: phosphatidylserine/phosphatidylglycerophosphate/cardiolipin synthase family protein [Elusimicrobiota bacterium]